MKPRDATASARVARQRSLLADSGGARVDAHLDAQGIAKLDALINHGLAASRREAIALAVTQMLVPPRVETSQANHLATAAATETLPPCPFCGQIHTVIPRESEGLFQILCDPANGGCGASSGFRSNMDAAMCAWEQRKSSPVSEKERRET